MEGIAFGRSIRALRIRRRWTQAALAARAGVSRSKVARVEQGRVGNVTVATLEQVASALGARVLVKLLWQGDGLDRLLDGRHAAVVEAIVRFLRSAQWIIAPEVSFNEYGERGSIDVFAFHPETRSLLVVEVKTTIADAQDLQSKLDRKVRLAPRIARDRGWSPTTVSTLLVVVDSRTNRRHISQLAETFGAAFPARGIAVRRWLGRPTVETALRGLWFVNTGHQAVVTQRVRATRSAATHEAAVGP